MKVKKEKGASITQPLLNDLLLRSKLQAQQTSAIINRVDSMPLPQPDLYQDSGSGYNAKFVFPQD